MAAVYRLDSPSDISSIPVHSSCAFGVFDGVHRGHQFIINAATEAGRSGNNPVLVITFDRDPDELLHPDRLKKLMTNETRIAHLAREPVDAVVVIPFTSDFASLSADNFLELYIEPLSLRLLHVGLDLRFGSKATGTADSLSRWGQSHAITTYIYDLFSLEGEPVTASRIRSLLQECQVGEAAELLGHPYELVGEVLHGRAEGASFGIRTANLEVPPLYQVLGEGVYGACANVGESRYRAAVSVGVSPTFVGRASANVEAHLLDFDGDLYGRTITLSFSEYLRPLKRFSSTEELITAMSADITHVRKFVSLTK